MITLRKTNMKKTASIMALCLLTLCLTPSAGLSWYGHRPYHHHHYHGGDAWAWGLSGLIIGGALVAAATQPVVYAAPPPVVYAPPLPVVYAPPPAAVYAYPPDVPPGMCRWERYVLDGYGQTLLDRNGQPIKEYTLGSCQAPPN